MVGSGSSGGGGEEGFTGRAAMGYDHGYDGEIFYLGLALEREVRRGLGRRMPGEGLASMTRMRSYFSGISGRTRPSGRWCLTVSRPTVR